MIVNELYNNKEEITLQSYLEKYNITDWEEFVRPTGKYIDNYMAYYDIPYAVQEIKFLHFCNNDDISIYIIQDADVDGICSALILYQYLVRLMIDGILRF